MYSSRTKILALSALLFLPLSASAQQVTKTDQSVEMILGNDVYTAGAAVDITRNIAGDINAAGSDVMIKGGVGGDVQAAGSNVSISGTVRDDVRVAGGNVTISGQVTGDVIAFGGKIYIAKGTVIGGNLVAAGGEITVEGSVRGNVKLDAGKVTLNGEVGGLTDVRAEKSTVNSILRNNASLSVSELTMGQNMSVQGDLRYWSKAGKLNTAGKVSGTATFDPALARKIHEKSETPAVIGAVLAAFSLYSLLASALVIGLLMLATKTMFTESARRLQKKPWLSLLVGVLFFIATPGVILLLAITFIGIPLALALLAIYLITVFFSCVLSSVVLARWAELRSKQKWHPAGVFFASLGIYILLKLLTVIPFIGWLLSFLIVASAYGALMMVKAERYKKVM